MTTAGVDLGETYLNDHRCKEFIQSISSVMKSDLHLQLAVFGEEGINVLSEHFNQLLEKNDFDGEEALSEWLDLKVVVKNNYRNLRKQAVWQVMFTDFTERFCNILMLIEILLVLPVSTACCERGFSCMSRIKTQYRSGTAGLKPSNGPVQPD